MKKEKMEIPRSSCPVSNTLEIIGDRWTLLVVRDLLKGKKRYNEFIESAEKIPTNILSNRLKMLEEKKIVKKELYSQHPPRSEYVLTDDGRELGEVVKAIYKWGQKRLINKQNVDALK